MHLEEEAVPLVTCSLPHHPLSIRYVPRLQGISRDLKKSHESVPKYETMLMFCTGAPSPTIPYRSATYPPSYPPLAIYLISTFLGPRGPLVLPLVNPYVHPTALKILTPIYIQAYMPHESSGDSSNQPIGHIGSPRRLP